MKKLMERIKGLLSKAFAWAAGQPKDKILHFTAGMVLYLAAGMVVKVVFPESHAPWLFPLTVTICAAGLKELVWDKKTGGSIEKADFWATVIGGVTAGVLTLFGL